ncbi:replication initiation protein [Corynebacterium stationis]|uniref:replication initiation protein n=2 Tax=Corynebacterium stationis TaxID=1705 RepID=UPI00262102BD|nr:replication initiation protein [Corynebacterium stationis]
MIIPNNAPAIPIAGSRVNTPSRLRPDCAGLDDTPASSLDRDKLLAHLGRTALHGSISRNFKGAYRLVVDKETGKKRSVPNLYRIDSDKLGRCEYVMLTSKQYASVMVIDVDQIGKAGGHPENLNSYVKGVIWALVQHGIGPAWAGINPINGKAQFIWLIDPVYAGKNHTSRNMELLKATSHELGELLDHDPHFAHRFSRSPFYTRNSPEAYRWYCQHDRVIRLQDFLRQVREMAGQSQHIKNKRQQFNSGRELINAVKARREEAQAFKALADDVENEINAELDQYDPELIDGVRVRWISQGVAARDETAFSHALKIGHRLRKAGQRLTDAAIIDAYEHAYNVAQQQGSAGRDSEMPPMRDRQTMARRVRGYVTQSKTNTSLSSNASGRATSSERKALATMGRKGGQKAAQRWKTDPEGQYAQNQLQKLKKTHRKKRVEGQTTRAKIQALIGEAYVQTGEVLTRKQIVDETGLSRATVTRHLAALREQGALPEM